MKKSIIVLSFLFLGTLLGISSNSLGNNLDSPGEITCWSSGSTLPFNRYVECATCITKTGSPSGGKGTCDPSTPQ